MLLLQYLLNGDWIIDIFLFSASNDGHGAAKRCGGRRDLSFDNECFSSTLYPENWFVDNIK